MSSLPGGPGWPSTAGVRQTGIAPKTGSSCRIRCGRPGPVGIAVAVDVIDLEGAARGVHPNATELSRGEEAGHDCAYCAIGEGKYRQRHVLELNRTSDPRRTTVDGLPRAQQVEKQVDLMDAVSEGRSAALADPVATPLGQEVVVGAVPQGFADGYLRSSQRA